MIIKIIFQNKKFRRAFSAVSLALLAGCNKTEVAPASNAAAPAAAPVVVAAPVAQVPVAVAADYVYYPSYGVYYSPDTRVYWYMQGGGWASGPAVPGVTVDLLASVPSVRMDFHDSPANHHAAVVQQYPRDWKPADPGRGTSPGRGPDTGRGPDPGRGAPDDGRGRRE